MTVQETEHPAIDVLRVLAISRSSGALEVRGVPGGAFFLHEGEVTYAETIGVPPVPETSEPDPELPSMIRSTILEAGVEMLTAPRVEGDRPLFRPGRRHWTGLRCRVAVEHLIAEITDLVTNFRRLGVGPDDEVRLAWLPRGRTVVIDAQEWALTGRLTGAQSPRSLARRSGIPLTAALGSIASLIASGVAKLVHSETGDVVTVPPAPADLPRPQAPETGPLETDRAVSASSILTASKPITTPPAPDRLPRRRPRTAETDPDVPRPDEATEPPPEPPSRPAPGLSRPDAPPRPASLPEGLDPDSRVAIAMRVLEGLKRL
ncbi:DUF4388 domain-containing protein [Kineosporia sp. J2-2]|uniref:DUF4388 domain-containing protein n=1 Tax=Kineosporia corallincola TaxID=2835133 RepID=A0ABS5T8A6_9ACTN|nr:hypothetical protein [Kineosporia corallincola]MBT0767305.1 DUF4388 domain-containing protein [Kineosporia corallincola]